MHVARLLPASIHRAFLLLKTRFLAIFADLPVLFFAVVIGVALTFRVAVGAVRDAAHPEPEAPTFATGPAATGGPIVTGPEPGLAALPSATTTTTTAEVGAAAKVQPIGSPLPSRAAPKPAARAKSRRKGSPLP